MMMVIMVVLATCIDPDHVTRIDPDHVTRIDPDHVTRIDPDHVTRIDPDHDMTSLMQQQTKTHTP